MIIRLGYVAMTLNLADCSPSQTVTAAALSRLPDRKAMLYRLRKITGENLKNTLRILRLNKYNNIKVYRFTSKLVPLATHPIICDWDYTADFSEKFREIGDFVKENGFRVSAHPDHYTVINSNSEDVFEASLKDLEYHERLFEAMGLDSRYKLVLHVGGLYREKASSIERFKSNFRRLPENIRKRITIENDDKSYGASDVLGICRDLEVPMVFDVHHHNCVNRGERLEDLLPDVFSTWDKEIFKPKIHFSSPKSPQDFKSHADLINPDDFLFFIKAAAGTGYDFDVMLEAKQKDAALLTLSEQLKKVEGLKRINEGEFEL